MIGRFDWNKELPDWLRDEIAAATEALIKPSKHDKTVELRTRIKVLREVLALPDKPAPMIVNQRQDHQ